VLSRLLSTDGGAELLSRIAIARTRTMTAVDAVIPPGTVLDAIARVLRDETDLPPEMGLAYGLGLLSAAIAQTGSTITVPGVEDPVELALWIVLLAPSGAGKTLVRKLIIDGLRLDPHEIPEPGSARAYLDGLAACDGRAVWLRDEFGQLIRQIADRRGPMATLRDLMLRTYDHGRLETNTRRDGQVLVEHPVVTIIGSSVSSTWAGCVDAAMLADGLLARFMFVVARRRPLSVPLYATREMIDAVRSAVTPRLRERLRQRAEYRLSHEARELYIREWRTLAKQIGDGIDPAYYRRVTWSAMRLSAIYHVLQNADGDEIGPEAMRWA